MAITGSVTVVTRDEPAWRGACIALIVIGVTLSSSLLTTQAVMRSVDRHHGQRFEGATADVVLRLEALEKSFRGGNLAEMGGDIRSILESQRAIWDAMRGVTATYEEGGLTGPREIYKHN